MGIAETEIRPCRSQHMASPNKSALESGDDVLVSGLGKCFVRQKNERRGGNPATDREAILPAGRVVTFTCSGKLHVKVNGG